MKSTPAASIASTLTVAALLLASVLIASCSETQVYQQTRPTSAELQIEVIGPDGIRRWVTSRRIEYRYPEDELLTLGGTTEDER